MLILSRVHHLFLFITSSCLNSLISLAEFLKTLPPNLPLPSNSYFLAKTSPISQVTADLFFFLFSSLLPPRSFFFSYPFPSLVWFSRLWGPKTWLLSVFHSNGCEARFQKAKQYFAGFYFRDFNRQIWKKALNFGISRSLPTPFCEFWHVTAPRRQAHVRIRPIVRRIRNP